MAYDRFWEFAPAVAAIPYLAPELALLFKAKAVRPKDQQDLARALPLLDATQRETLAALVERLHPGHGRPAELRSQRAPAEAWAGGAEAAAGTPDVA
ncbi:hypothetical protein ACFRJ1_27805 [Streptomyces sp. NPDC056773]|uniref:hypothetical protein n=1 Tax=unclassified Streptomyces TaxID=2593676 RepID=UPI0036B2AB50